MLPAAFEALRRALPEHEVACCPSDRVLEHVADVDVLVPARGRITAAVLDAAPRCRLVQQIGAGVDMVDIPAAAARGVPVCNVPSLGSGNAESVAEMALFLMIGVARSYPLLQEAVRGGDWSVAPLGRALRGSTVGIVAVGGIGSVLARLLHSFGCRVLGVKRRPTETLRRELGLAWLGGMEDLDDLLPRVDFLVLTIPLTAETRGLIDGRRLARMQPGSYLINVSRGPIVDHDALVDALASGHLAGAGLDVFWQEPMDPSDPIFRQRVVATPHVAGYTGLTFQGASAAVAENVRRLLAGEPLLYRQN
jgi:phosphoglycerate dehydrogenase-like enzyme